MSSSTPAAALELVGVTKAFPGVVALDDVSMRVAPGEVVGLIGENGAGKSSLLKVLTGVYTPDSGDLLVAGRKVVLGSPRSAFDHGIGMVFQEQSLLLNMSIAENMFLGREGDFTRLGVLNKRRMFDATRKELAKVDLDLDPATICAKLTFGQRQLVEIAKALSLEGRIDGAITILLDEPTSVLEEREVQLLFRKVRELRTRASFVFISHRLDEVLAISDRVYVMRDGKVTGEVKASEANVHELHRLMVGRSLKAEYYREERQTGAGPRVVLRAQGLERRGAFRDVTFELHEGEVLGIAGVVGSGREQLARCLAGLDRLDGGTVEVEGQALLGGSAPAAVHAGIGYIPRERKLEGIVGAQSVAENLSLARLRMFSRQGVLRKALEREVARHWIDRLHIKTPSEATPIGSLSGGNQQKAVLAKWRIAGSKVLILDHPTRGVDVGAKEDVYELVRDMTQEGLCVILLADTLEELIGLSGRVIVMRDGRISAEVAAPVGAKPDQVRLIEYMV
jgi:ribose transport system ATP-binding protein